MDKGKLVITIDGGEMDVEIKGDVDALIVGTMGWICDNSIECGISKKDFLEFSKMCYEAMMEEINNAE